MKKYIVLLLGIIYFLNPCTLHSAPQSTYTQNSAQVFKAGAFTFDTNKLIRNLDANVKSWVDTRDWGKNRDEKESAFYSIYAKVIEAIKQGNLSRGYDRIYRDATGQFHNSNTSWDATGAVFGFLDTIIDHMISYGNYIK